MYYVVVCALPCPPQVISGADVALYGGLTALASFDRPELRSQVRLLRLQPRVLTAPPRPSHHLPLLPWLLA